MASSQVSPSAVNSSSNSSAVAGVCSTTTTSTTGSNSGAQTGVIITTTNNNNSMDDMSDDAPNGPDPNRWFFEKERLETTPSRKCGIDPDKELMLRQQSANFIQDMGQRLHVNQLCINTAIVYMHRFYMYHSFSHFHQNHVSTAAIFLAAKVEEQPRKLEHVIKVAHYCLNRDAPQIDTKSEAYAEQAQELVMTENILLQTLGFDVAIDHPHAHVVKCCQLVRASKDLAQTSYFMATNSLHLTTMCLQYKPTVVACVCIHLTCKWSNWEIPRSKEGRDWFWYVDDTVTMDQLEKLTTEFLAIFDKSPSRLKKKILSLNQGGGGTSLSLSAYPTLNMDPKSPQSQSRSSPATSSHPSSNQALKRSSVGMKPSSSQIGTKQAKVNGGIPHHSVKPPHSSQIPPNSSSSSSKHPHYSSSSGSKGMLPPGSHHGAKDAHSSVQSHSSMKPPPPGHHHSSSSSSSGHPPPNYPHSGSSSSSSSSRPSSHPVHHSSSSSSSNNPSSHQSASQVSKSSHALPGHPPGKPPHPQPSKVPYNYNMKSQIPSSSSSSSTQPISKPAPPPSSSSSSQQQQPSSKVPPHFPQPPPPAYNQKKQGPYPPPLDPSSRRDPAPDFNGKRESGSIEDSSSLSSSNRRIQSSRSRPDQGKPDSAYSTSGSGGSSNLPPVSLPFNAATTSEPGRLWPDNGTGGSNTSSMEPRIPPGRTSLFSPDPDLMESSSFISSTLGTALKPELSPIGDLSVGAKGASSSNNNNNNTTGGVVGDGDSSADSYFAVPSAVSSSVFPNLFEYNSGSGGPSIFDSSLDLLPPLDSINSMPLLSSSSSSAAAVPLPPSVTSLAAGSLMKTDSPTRRLPENSVHEDEPPHKKVKKAKKEKHKHKDKDRHEEKRERKDKEEKKHKDKNREKSRGDEGTTTKKHKEKHKKDKHKEKGEREKSGKGPGKYPGEMMLMDSFGGPDLSSSATNRLKINLGSSRIEPPAPAGGAPLLLPPPQQQSFMMEKSKSSKHSSKKHKSNLPSSSSGSSGPGDNAAGAPPGIKLKIVPPRPPTLDDGRL